MQSGGTGWLRAGIFALSMIPSAVFGQALLVYDQFDDATRLDGTDPYDTSWFMSHPDLNVGGTAPGIDVFNSEPLSDYVLAFGGPSTYAYGVGAFATSTLSSPGASITMSMDFSVQGSSNANAGYGPIIGLFHNGGTPLLGDITGVTGQATHDDVGYALIYERGFSGNLFLVSIDNSSFSADFAYGPRPTVATWALGLETADTNGHTLSLTFVLAGNGVDLIAIPTLDGYTGTPQTLAGAALTYSFNEALIGPWSGSTGYVDNIAVLYTNAVPEPSAFALVAGAAALGWLVRRRKSVAG